METERTPTVEQPCPLCGTRDFEPVARFPDGVAVGRCRACGLTYTPLRHARPHGVLAPAPLDQIRSAYAPILQDRKAHYRRRNYREYLTIIERFATGRRLLDIGTAHGFFGREARMRGFQVTGVEPNPAMSAFAREENGLDVVTGRLDQVDLDDREFDVVTFTDSLEYIPDPLGALATVKTHLAPRGILFVKVPNARYSELRRKLAAVGIRMGGGTPYGPSMRVVHYDARTLAELLRRSGFVILDVGWPSPIHSPPTLGPGAWSEVAPRWYEQLPHRLVRSGVHWAGRLQAAVFRGRNDGSPSVYAVGVVDTTAAG